MNSSSRFAKHQVLIVDDNPGMSNVLTRVFANRGIKVLTAENGDEGLALIRKHHPDVVLLDMMMPKRSGIMVLEHLRTKVEQPLPVIMMTANTGKRHRQYIEQLGVEDYFIKPFPIPKLIEAVERILESLDGGKEGESANN